MVIRWKKLGVGVDCQGKDYVNDGCENPYGIKPRADQAWDESNGKGIER